MPSPIGKRRSKTMRVLCYGILGVFVTISLLWIRDTVSLYLRSTTEPAPTPGNTSVQTKAIRRQYGLAVSARARPQYVNTDSMAAIATFDARCSDVPELARGPEGTNVLITFTEDGMFLAECRSGNLRIGVILDRPLHIDRPAPVGRPLSAWTEGRARLLKRFLQFWLD